MKYIFVIPKHCVTCIVTSNNCNFQTYDRHENWIKNRMKKKNEPTFSLCDNALTVVTYNFKYYLISSEIGITDQKHNITLQDLY